jgi:hypothetical protein
VPGQAAIAEPAIKRAIAFIDGQNLFHHAREAFGYHFPNYDIRKLAERICAAESWNLVAIQFYTGVPDRSDNPFWNYFWTRKLASMGRQGIKVFSRSLRYRNKTVELADGSNSFVLAW